MTLLKLENTYARDEKGNIKIDSSTGEKVIIEELYIPAHDVGVFYRMGVDVMLYLESK
jgi:hypothetical protein